MHSLDGHQVLNLAIDPDAKTQTTIRGDSLQRRSLVLKYSISGSPYAEVYV
jgi:hypothetical protein